MATVLILMVCEMLLGEVKADILSLLWHICFPDPGGEGLFTGTLRNIGRFYFPQLFQIFFPARLSPFLLGLLLPCLSFPDFGGVAV